MSISKEEKEKLYEEFKNKLEKDGIKTTTAAYRNLHNLERARDHFTTRVEGIRKLFHFDAWSEKGLHWTDWNYIVRLICHIYGVSVTSNLPMDRLDEVNDFAIKMMDELFDKNIDYLKSIES